MGGAEVIERRGGRPRLAQFKSGPDVPARSHTMAEFWIKQGWYRREGRLIVLKRAQWEAAPETRSAAVRFLVEKVLHKDPREVTDRDFRENMLSGMLSNSRTCIYTALQDAGYRFPPWEMENCPKCVYKAKKYRVQITRWVVRDSHMDACDVRTADFKSRGQQYMLGKYYGGSAYAALIEAGYRVQPWEMGKAPNGFYKVEENRIAAIRWLAMVCGTREPGTREFEKHGLRGLLVNYYDEVPRKALAAAGLA